MGSLQDLKAAMHSSQPKMARSREDIKQSVYEQIEKTPASSVKSETKTDSNLIKSDDTAASTINSLLAYYIRVTGSYARLNGEILTNNMLVVLEGLPADDRIVSLESMMFIANNFGKMTAAMILNHKNIRDVFVKAISRELDLAKLSEAERVDAHRQTGNGFADDVHTMELGVTRFTTDMELIIADKMSESIDAIGNTRLSAEVDKILSSYSQQDADDMGAILSNPIYLLVAFNNNEEFVQEITQICEDMMITYN